MANFDVKPQFDTAANMIQPTDPAHADLFNGHFGRLYNNDAYLKEQVDNSKTTQTTTGNNPTTSNSTNGNLIYLKDKGYTEQKTLSGKNLVMNTATSQTINGVTFTVNEDGSVTAKGTTTGKASLTIESNILQRLTVGETYKISGTDRPAEIAYHDSTPTKWLNEFTASDNTKNIKIYLQIDTDTTVDKTFYPMVCLASVTDDTYEPYCGGIASPNPDYPQEIKGLGASGMIDVKTCGKNIKDCYNTTWRGNGSTTFTMENGVITITRYANAYSGIYTHALFKGLDHLIDKKMVLSLMAKTDTSGMSIRVATNGKSVSAELTTNYQKVSLPFTYTGSKELTIYGNVVAGNVYIKDMQLELGDTATDYEPYTETQALIPISAPLYDGDYIEVYADGSGQIYRKMNTTTLDESANWRISSAAVGKVFLGSSVFAKNSSVKCSHFASSKCGVDNNKNLWILTDFATLDDFKAWITDNNITILFEKAEPTTEQLTAEQVSEFMKLQTFKGITHVTADGEVTVRYYCNNDSGDTVKMQIVSHIGMVIHSTTLDTMEKVISIYGGKTWEKIEGRFLLGQSDAYEIGAEGGEETHTLTIEELPSHIHNVSMITQSTQSKAIPASGETVIPIEVFSGVLEHPTITQSTGSNQSHNNMPPYKVVYIWERTE